MKSKDTVLRNTNYSKYRRHIMKKYRVREGSIADYARIAFVSIAFWGILIATAITSYPA